MTLGLSVFSWYSFVALVIAGVESGLQLPGLTTGLPVRQVLEQGDDTDPQVERDTRLEYVTVREVFKKKRKKNVEFSTSVEIYSFFFYHFSRCFSTF